MPYGNKENLYFRVYDLFPKGQFKHAIILGSTTSSDASISLGAYLLAFTVLQKSNSLPLPVRSH